MQRQLHSRVQRAAAARRGLSLIEIMIALMVFSLAAAGMLSSLTQTSKLNRFNRELTVATRAVESTLEQMLAVEFRDVWATFNADPTDDPGAPGTAFGNTFTVGTLTPQEGDADGLVGRIDFPTIGGMLREDFVDEDLSMPRDLNLDLVIDADDHSLDCRILPVRIRAEWTGVSGDNDYEIIYLFSDLAE